MKLEIRQFDQFEPIPPSYSIEVTHTEYKLTTLGWVSIIGSILLLIAIFNYKKLKDIKSPSFIKKFRTKSKGDQYMKMEAGDEENINKWGLLPGDQVVTGKAK